MVRCVFYVRLCFYCILMKWRKGRRARILLWGMRQAPWTIRLGISDRLIKQACAGAEGQSLLYNSILLEHLPFHKCAAYLEWWIWCGYRDKRVALQSRSTLLRHRFPHGILQMRVSIDSEERKCLSMLNTAWHGRCTVSCLSASLLEFYDDDFLVHLNLIHPVRASWLLWIEYQQSFLCDSCWVCDAVIMTGNDLCIYLSFFLYECWVQSNTKVGVQKRGRTVPGGVDPPTFQLTAECSTVELQDLVVSLIERDSIQNTMGIRWIGSSLFRIRNFMLVSKIDWGTI